MSDSKTAMKAYLAAKLVSKKVSVQDIEYLVVDLEMTGLDSDKDKILSIGYVPILDSKIVVKEMRHQFIKDETIEVGQSPTIHGILKKDMEQGVQLSSAIDTFLEAATGRVLVFHHAGLDLSFMNKAIKEEYGFELPTRFIDTLAVERKRLERSGQPVARLRLDECRERYGLPRYKSHSAAIDAMATAELWLAQIAKVAKGNQVPLSFFL